jgi:hypothetical protein
MPHQRPSTISVLRERAGNPLAALNAVFDQAFQPSLSARWQSAAALRTALQRVIEAPAQAAIESPSDRLERIRINIAARPTKGRDETVERAFGEMNTILQMAQRDVRNSLGPEFTTTQGGYNVRVAEGRFRNKLGIWFSHDDSKGVEVTFVARVTGSELIVAATTNGSEKELMRVPLDSPLPTADLQAAAVEYFTGQLERAL